MKDDLNEQLELLRRTVADLEKASRQALGFVRTIQYMGITFNISKRFVIADLSPIAFFHLIEHIDDNAESAVFRLYERLSPLLTCRHQWTLLKREEDRQIRSLGINPGPPPHICRRCTAYALGESLPTIGRTLA